MHRLVSAKLTDYLTGMDRQAKQALMMAVDIMALVFTIWSAYSLRFGEVYVPSSAQWLLVLAAPLLAVPVFIRMGLYRSVIRYIGEQALWSVVRAMSLAALMWAVLAYMTQMTGAEGVPRSVLLLYWLMGMVLVGGSRFAARWMLWAPLRQRFRGRQVLIYGAGSSGRQLVASLRRGGDLFPAGFLDDDVNLHGKDVDSQRVYRPLELPALIQRFDIGDVIVSLPSVSEARRKEVVVFLEQHPVRVRILPAMTDIASGKHLVNMVREVDIGDLLGRDLVVPDQLLLKQCIAGKTVMVTGAGGSIGAELCRQIVTTGPTRLIILDSSEYAIYQVERMLRSASDCAVVPVLGSVQDAGLLNRLITCYAVQTLYHAAAYKHVPLVEANALEGARNNVLGTQAVAQAVFDQGVKHFVLISTDKAVRPTNVMGATKRWAEWIVQDFARRADEAGSGQCFCAVRFGNVLGSSGSVIPLFKEQIALGGPVTVTHAKVTRYFMSIHEAVQLVIQAGSMAGGGEIYLLDMGDPVKIIDLARNMVRLAGHSVRDELNDEGNIDIVVTGLRPGEKLYEELLIDGRNAEGTSHPRIMKAMEAAVHPDGMNQLLNVLKEALNSNDEARVRKVLFKALEPEFTDSHKQ